MLDQNVLAERVVLKSNGLGSSGWGVQVLQAHFSNTPAGRIHSWLRGRRKGRRNKGSEIGPAHQSLKRLLSAGVRKHRTLDDVTGTLRPAGRMAKEVVI